MSVLTAFCNYMENEIPIGKQCFDDDIAATKYAMFGAKQFLAAQPHDDDIVLNFIEVAVKAYLENAR